MIIIHHIHNYDDDHWSTHQFPSHGHHPAFAQWAEEIESREIHQRFTDNDDDDDNDDEIR